MIKDEGYLYKKHSQLVISHVSQKGVQIVKKRL